MGVAKGPPTLQLIRNHRASQGQTIWPVVVPRRFHSRITSDGGCHRTASWEWKALVLVSK